MNNLIRLFNVSPASRGSLWLSLKHLHVLEKKSCFWTVFTLRWLGRRCHAGRAPILIRCRDSCSRCRCVWSSLAAADQTCRRCTQAGSTLPADNTGEINYRNPRFHTAQISSRLLRSLCLKKKDQERKKSTNHAQNGKMRWFYFNHSIIEYNTRDCRKSRLEVSKILVRTFQGYFWWP